MAHPASPPTPVAPVAGGRATDAGPQPRAPRALLLALLAVVAYALFAHGATDTPAETRVQVALAVTALLAVVGLASGRSGVRLDAPLVARVGVLLLLAFAVWCGVSLLWSVAPDRTWTQINRGVAYALIAGLGLVLGASLPRAAERLAAGWLLVVVAVALYALGGKTFPGVNVPGLFDLNQTGTLSRLRAPLEYWNALALVLVMALPVALRLAVDRTRGTGVRTGAMLAAFLFLIDLGMTYSRGGVLALVVLVAVLVTLGGTGRLKTVLALAVAGVAAVGPLGVAFTRDGLAQSGAPLGDRIVDGRVLAMTVVMAAFVLVAVTRSLIAAEGRLRWSTTGTRTVGRACGIAGAAVVLLLAVGGAGSVKGLPANVDEAVRSFTVPSQDMQLDPSRLATTTSGNRWVWWKEAAGAFSDRPVGGWGAGSFRVTHLRYRTNTISVTQPHSVPLQFLAETGLVGLLLVAGGVGTLLWVAVARVRGMRAGRERELSVALLAAVLAWAAHGAYDWDWDIPGVTLPPLLFLGVLAGGAFGAGGTRRDAAPAVVAPVVVFADPEREATLRPGALAGVAIVTVALFAYATSAILPAWSADKADAAQELIGGDQVDDDTLRRAAAQADLAADLDPLSIEPLLVAATIAERRGRTLEARQALLDAVRRQPESARAWLQLATLTLQLGDRTGFQEATARALSLDPHNPLLRQLAFRAVSFRAPSGDSATATGTPLPAAPVVAPVVPVAPVAPVAPAAAPVAP